MVKCGLEIIVQKWPSNLKDKNVGLLCHASSVDSKYSHASEIIQKLDFIDLRCLFGPQHGIWGWTQANMIKWHGGYLDTISNLPVYSLYGKQRKPTFSMLNDIDLLIIDLFDIGSRYYTYIWTMELCLEACLEYGKSVVVLDRPNPIGASDIEGPVLNEKLYSFVGLKKLPIRHGMTIGEIAMYLKDQYHKKLDLTIISMDGYNRSMYFEDTKLPWVMPSPNIPTIDSTFVYPGMCLLEGTNISEGRGTTRPFEIFGAPFIDSYIISNRLNNMNLPGVYFRPLYFQPTFDKFKDKVCGGAQLHIIDRRIFKPFYTGLAIINTIMEIYPRNFTWSVGPYEYEEIKKPIDILTGDDNIRISLENRTPLDNIEVWYNSELSKFKIMRNNYLLYN